VSEEGRASFGAVRDLPSGTQADRKRPHENPKPVYFNDCGDFACKTCKRHRQSYQCERHLGEVFQVRMKSGPGFASLLRLAQKISIPCRLFAKVWSTGFAM
jgi:hypothetical protein